ncbi:unnamed protein product [Dovyalis caffra]|uniref:SPARK domain-containing protein n=1 Tax=Dovyalis caffra TaxID=77055 RepID=A0AAV1SAL5_9ROSI|nr:unnamed protein product [Dovyalis caffra]
MGRKLFFSSFLCLFFFTIFSIDSNSATSSCPIDLSYVQTVPWDTSLCRESDGSGHCCQTLLSVFGMGLAQHLKETSLFQLPNANASSACLSDFQAKLAALSINPSLVPSCFKDSTQFVANTSSCVGIVTARDWIEKVGPMTPLNTACSGDFSELTRCSSCLEAGQKILSQLTSIDPNATSKCFYYTCLYAAGIVSKLGPLDATTAACTLALPLANSGTKKPAKSKDRLLKLVFGLLGALIGVLLAFGLITMYRKSEKKRKVNASHDKFVSSFKASVLPNSGAKWFHLSELERVTRGKVIDTSNSSFLLITDWAWTLAKSGKLQEIVDESIRDQGPKGVMERFVLVGILCAHVMVAFRPTIADALKMLEGDIDIPRLPERPLPLGHESFRPLWHDSSRTADRSRTSSSSRRIM